MVRHFINSKAQGGDDMDKNSPFCYRPKSGSRLPVGLCAETNRIAGEIPRSHKPICAFRVDLHRVSSDLDAASHVHLKHPEQP